MTPARQRLTPYGNERTGTTTTLPGTDHDFLGQPEDPTGLNYLNNRYHDPALGIFLSVDPLVASTGHPYLYADGNPVGLSDPSGLCSSPYAPVPCPGPSGYGPGSGPGGTGSGGSAPASSGHVPPGGYPRSPGRVATLEQSDNMFVFITAEMMTNREDSMVQQAKPSGCDLLCMLSGVSGLPGQLAASSPDPVAVIAVGLKKFRSGAEWDHKPHIRQYTGDAEWLLLDGERAVRFDMLSNIHYGFIFAEMEVGESIAQFAANAGEVWAPLAEITGTNDDVDRLAISIGYGVHSAVPPAPETLMVYNDAIRGLLSENFDVLVYLGGACYVAECS